MTLPRAERIRILKELLDAYSNEHFIKNFTNEITALTDSIAEAERIEKMRVGGD